MGNASSQGDILSLTRVQDVLADHEKWLSVIYVLGALCFTLAIFDFRKPSTSQAGNAFAIIGMLASIAGTLASCLVNGYGYWIFLGVFLCFGAMSIFMAMKVKMTSMPLYVGFLNAMGGLAAALESLALYVSPTDAEQQESEWAMGWNSGGKRFQIYNTIFYLLGMIIGIITFTGSMTAVAKLSEKFRKRPKDGIQPKRKRIFNKLLKARTPITVLIAIVICATAATAGALGIGVEDNVVGLTCFVVCMFVSGLYGIFFVCCIGGADMPVVISLLNSFSGWSTVFAGLAFGNELMMIAGCFVGASGLILSVLMCQAMNRSLTNVLVGGFGDDSGGGTTGDHLDAHIMDAAAVAKVIAGSKLMYIVPGYGMAAGQAQQEVAQLIEAVNHSGREARCAVHPVAGRLPGHMNVLLAEANVGYNYIDDITANDRMKDVDLVLVVGANDIYNPAAKFDKKSNIYGMEVLQIWEAKRTVVVKRSLNSGYAGIDNMLFFYPQNGMCIGDAKGVIAGITEAFKAEVTGGDMDSVEAWMRTDDQRIEVRQKQYTALMNKKPDEEVEEEMVKLSLDGPHGITIGVLREPHALDDLRIPIHPKDIDLMLHKKEWGVEKIMVEKSGSHVHDGALQDADFAVHGTVVSRSEILSHADIVVSMTIPSVEELTLIGARHMSHADKISDFEINAPLMRGGEVEMGNFRSRQDKPILISLFGNPSGTADLQKHCAEIGITLLSMDIMPRVTTAQCMDVLSSSAKVAGFRAVIEACNQYGRLIGAEITAAGSYPPAKCLVVGVGVAGLQCIGDMNRLGAEVRAFDVRKECADQVQSMGGKFLVMDFGDEDGAGAGGYANIMSDEFIKKEMELFSEQAKECQIFILTAAIPGRRAPILFKDYHVQAMKPGSVVIDLAAPTGGNCESTRPGENYTTPNGVKMIGKVDFVKGPAANITSQMLSANLVNWLDYNHKQTGSLNVFDCRDKIIRAIALTHQGQATWPAPRPPAPPVPAQGTTAHEVEEVVVVKENKLKKRNPKMMNMCPMDWIVLTAMFLIFAVFGYTAPNQFNSKLMILVLASWLGYLLVCGVTVALHTPLMSLTNAISGVVIVAAMLNISPRLAAETWFADDLCRVGSPHVNDFVCKDRSITTIVINALALAAASMNVAGGFAVTRRMLMMFKSR